MTIAPTLNHHCMLADPLSFAGAPMQQQPPREKADGRLARESGGSANTPTFISSHISIGFALGMSYTFAICQRLKPRSRKLSSSAMTRTMGSTLRTRRRPVI